LLELQDRQQGIGASGINQESANRKGKGNSGRSFESSGSSFKGSSKEQLKVFRVVPIWVVEASE